MNRDELKGKGRTVKGKVKQSVGRATGDERMRSEGVDDEAGGRVQEGFGRARRKVGNAIKDVGDRIKR